MKRHKTKSSAAENSRSNLNRRIAARIRELRSSRNLSLDALAHRSGVSRSMISLIERGESSPTAVVLEKLATALGIVLAALFDPPDSNRPGSAEPIVHRADQLEWRDPASGYLRRNLSPPAVKQPLQLVEVHFPPHQWVAFENAARGQYSHQQIWMLEGRMDITVGQQRHQLRKGDCLAMQLDQPSMFHNPTNKPAHYLVAIATDNHSRR